MSGVRPYFICVQIDTMQIKQSDKKEFRQNTNIEDKYNEIRLGGIRLRLCVRQVKATCRRAVANASTTPITASIEVENHDGVGIHKRMTHYNAHATRVKEDAPRRSSSP